MENHINENMSHGRKFRRIIDNDSKNWPLISFGDWGMRHSKDILFERQKLKRKLLNGVYNK